MSVHQPEDTENASIPTTGSNTGFTPPAQTGGTGPPWLKNLGGFAVNGAITGVVAGWVTMASKLPHDVALPVQIGCAGVAVISLVQFVWTSVKLSHQTAEADANRLKRQGELEEAEHKKRVQELENQHLRLQAEAKHLMQQMQKATTEASTVSNEVSTVPPSRSYVAPEIEEQKEQILGQGKSK